MAAHETLYEYYLHQQRSIVNYLELCLLHPEAELVHELRLSIKKLRAFHKLAEGLLLDQSDEHIHLKHRVRKLFKAAGQLRDTQVQILMLSRFGEQTDIQYPEFDTWLKTREMKQIQRFTKNPKQVVPQAEAQSNHQKIGKLLSLAEDEAILKSASEVLSDVYSTMRNLLAGHMSERNLHRIRIIAKQMRYIINIMFQIYPDFKFTYISVDSLREIEVAAGKWHDNLVRVELLEKFLKKKKRVANSDKLKYQKLFNSCSTELDDTFNKAYCIVKKEFKTETQD